MLSALKKDNLEHVSLRRKDKHRKAVSSTESKTLETDLGYYFFKSLAFKQTFDTLFELIGCTETNFSHFKLVSHDCVSFV